MLAVDTPGRIGAAVGITISVTANSKVLHVHATIVERWATLHLCVDQSLCGLPKSTTRKTEWLATSESGHFLAQPDPIQLSVIQDRSSSPYLIKGEWTASYYGSRHRRSCILGSEVSGGLTTPFVVLMTYMGE